MIFDILAYIFGFIMLLGFIFFFKLRDKRAEIELGKNPIIEMYCGFKKENLSATYPFARIAMYEDFFVLSSLLKFVIRYEETEFFKINKLFINNGIRLYDRDKNIIAVIWTSKYEKILEVMKKFKEIKIKDD